MEITEKTVDRISKLCKLNFDKNEKVELISGLNGMMGFVKTLQYLDTSSVPDTSAVLLNCGKRKVGCPMDDDIPIAPLTRDELLSSSPLNDGQAVIVPQTVEEG